MGRAREIQRRGPLSIEQARQECEKRGHKLYTLAQSPNKTISACVHCGYYKCSNKPGTKDSDKCIRRSQ